MFDRIVEWILSVLNSVPILFGADVQNAELVRAMAALLLIVLVIYVIARLSRSAMTRKDVQKRDTRDP